MTYVFNTMKNFILIFVSSKSFYTKTYPHQISRKQLDSSCPELAKDHFKGSDPFFRHQAYIVQVLRVTI